ncbi:uncharacterized protein MONBRDRAFT_25871 [Monosiga brevicollis MX1]|uniref:Nbr1 FW domain-containing protein n=1 Tax=Monosiga brevicollis TaxID=81824 RepID=A9V0Q4_MONBE|nr:uncharacterized protein MONBRDRAFT_25871 [Monosiga brevicollis MX1]EDQ88793.1 predicted protein [Monosiga brevicollis MX1]|eukprot:XP_001746406.1 hypothetical protein [Monosiga brevicollis MX1]
MSADDLVNMMQSMGTDDPSALVQRFCQLVPGMSQEAATFFLEANSWNLEAAVVSFFDQGGANAVNAAMGPQPSAELVCDVTFGDGEAVPPGFVFEKTWRLVNNGPIAWPPSTQLELVQGPRMHQAPVIHVPALDPGATCDLTVPMKSPQEAGEYAVAYRLCYINGGVQDKLNSRLTFGISSRQYFGDQIWVVITVAEGGTLPLLQKMNATHFGAESSAQSESGSMAPVFTYPSQSGSSGSAAAGIGANMHAPTFQMASPQNWNLSQHVFGSSARAFEQTYNQQQPGAGSDDMDTL